MKVLKTDSAQREKILGENPVMSELAKDSRKALARMMKLVCFSGGEFLFRQGERADGFYLISSGTATVSRISPEGREQVLHVFGEGEMVGEVPVFQGVGYPACATADGEVEALYVPGAEFIEAGEANPGILLEMLAVLSMRLRRFVSLIDDLSLKEVSARMAKHLLKLRDEAGTDVFQLDSSKTVLASKIGTISSTVSRTFARMQKKCIISVDGQWITVNRADELEDIAQGGKL